MLRSFAEPALAYDLVGLANRGLVSVGRETESIIKLDSPDVSCLTAHMMNSDSDTYIA